MNAVVNANGNADRNQVPEAIREALGVYADRMAVDIYDTLDSTNNLAKSRADETAPALYIARTQTAGRGRLGRSFHSPAHTGLYMTVAYTTSQPLGEAVRVTALASVAAVGAIEALTHKRPAIKWVNDIYLDHCKIGGILTEAVTLPDGGNRMIVGLGINLTTTEFPEGLRAPASCLFTPSEAHMASTAFADRLAGEITRRLLEAVDGITSPAACLQTYREHLCYVGETVLCTRGSESFEGVILGVDDGYSLLVSVGGETLTLSSGEISVRPVVR